MYVPVNPSESYPINRVLEDTTDSGTNYVQCKVYNGKTRALLQTVNLTDNGNRWFSGLITIPQDNAFSNGTWLLVTTTVYTDSGYTTVNTNYAQTSEQWLVQTRFDYRFLPQGLGPEWGEKLTTTFKEQVAALKPNDPPPAVDHTPALFGINSRLNAIEGAIRAIVIPEPEKPEKVNLQGLQSALDNLTKLVASLPKFEKTDQSAILNSLSNLHGAIQNHHAISADAHTKTQKAIKESVVPIMEQTAHQQVIDGIKNGSIDISLSGKNAEKQKGLKGLAKKYGL